MSGEPGADTHWSARSMPAATGMIQPAASRIWRAFGLKPHLVQTWTLPAEPQFIEKVRGVVGPYLGPSALHLVCDNYATHKTEAVADEILDTVATRHLLPTNQRLRTLAPVSLAFCDFLAALCD
jgi:hypothetical protein